MGDITIPQALPPQYRTALVSADSNGNYNGKLDTDEEKLTAARNLSALRGVTEKFSGEDVQAAEEYVRKIALGNADVVAFPDVAAQTSAAKADGEPANPGRLQKFMDNTTVTGSVSDQVVGLVTDEEDGSSVANDYRMDLDIQSGNFYFKGNLDFYYPTNPLGLGASPLTGSAELGLRNELFGLGIGMQEFFPRAFGSRENMVIPNHDVFNEGSSAQLGGSIFVTPQLDILKNAKISLGVTGSQYAPSLFQGISVFGKSGFDFLNTDKHTLHFELGAAVDFFDHASGDGSRVQTAKLFSGLDYIGRFGRYTLEPSLGFKLAYGETDTGVEVMDQFGLALGLYNEFDISKAGDRSSTLGLDLNWGFYNNIFAGNNDYYNRTNNFTATLSFNKIFNKHFSAYAGVQYMLTAVDSTSEVPDLEFDSAGNPLPPTYRYADDAIPNRNRFGGVLGVKVTF